MGSVFTHAIGGCKSSRFAAIMGFASAHGLSRFFFKEAGIRPEVWRTNHCVHDPERGWARGASTIIIELLNLRLMIVEVSKRPIIIQSPLQKSAIVNQTS